jgi:hypothetical protein
MVGTNVPPQHPRFVGRAVKKRVPPDFLTEAVAARAGVRLLRDLAGQGKPALLDGLAEQSRQDGRSSCEPWLSSSRFGWPHGGLSVLLPSVLGELHALRSTLSAARSGALELCANGTAVLASVTAARVTDTMQLTSAAGVPGASRRLR